MTIPEQIAKLREEFVGETFMGTPDHWYDDPHYWCVNGHRSRRYLKSESLRDEVCLACRETVYLGPKDLPGVKPL